MQLLFKEAYLLIPCTSIGTRQFSEEKLGAVCKLFESTYQNANASLINKQYIPEESDRTKIVAIAKSLKISVEWLDAIPDFEYKDNEDNNRQYKSAGCIIVQWRVNEEKLKTFGLKRAEIRPILLQQIVYLAWFKLIEAMKGTFLINKNGIPYFISVCSGYADNTVKIEWNKERIIEHSKELGQWAEIYTGQYSDYRKEVNLLRLAEDISNRQSELHFLNKNSALLYLDTENYKLHFKKDSETPESTGYMYDVVVKLLARFSVILHSMLVINKEIDIDTKNLSKPDYSKKNSEQIKADLEDSKVLQNGLQGVLSPIFTDLTRSHRQHYSAVLKRMMTILNIEQNWERILKKIDLNTQNLNSIYLKKQEGSQERQEKILNMVNFLLGSSIIFEIIGFIVRDEEMVNSINSVIGIVIIGILIIMFALFSRKKKD